jgi:hypothetical protein
MSRVAAIALLISSVSLGVSAADLQKVIQGTWVVDERARLEASPLYSLSTPERKKELEASIKKMPATQFAFTATTVRVVGGDPVAYKILKRTANSLVLDTAASADGLTPKDEITVEYVTDASIKMTTRSAGITLILNRAK